MFHKGEVPFVRLLIPLIMGISLGFYFPHPLLLKLRIIAALFVLAIFFLLLITYRQYSLYRYTWIFGLLIPLFILYQAYGLTVYRSGQFDDKHFSSQSPDGLIIQIRNEPKFSKGILRFESAVMENIEGNKTSSVTGKLLFSVQMDSICQLSLNYGDILLVPPLHNEVEPPYNPGEFNYKDYLANHQIYHQTFLTQDQVRIIKPRAGDAVITFSLNLRQKLVRKFHYYLPDKEAAALASTLILGYRAELNKELINAYSKTGTMHVLSVSGMHVGIVFLVLTEVLKPMDKNKRLRLIRAFLIVSVIWFYALLTGFSSPVCRAAVMLSFFVFGKALNKNQNTYNLIAISAFFLLLYNPYYLADAGFQLSYLAVVGLVYFHPKIYQAFFIRNRILDQIWSYSALSIAAQLATFPISLYYFHQFPVYFLISNLLIVLPVAIIMYAGIVFLFIPFIFIVQYLGMFLNWLINFSNSLIYHIENLPFASWGGIWISSSQFILLYAILGCAVLKISFERKILFPLSAFLLILTACFSFTTWINHNRHEMIFFSLKKNSVLAYLFQGKAIVISDLDSLNQLHSFSTLPVLEARGQSVEKFFASGSGFAGASYFANANFLQFADFRLIKWDRNFKNFLFTGRLKVNTVLISGNPTVTLSGIKTCIDFDSIIIDGTNPDYKIREWEIEAARMKIPCYVLKKNPAYIVKL